MVFKKKKSASLIFYFNVSGQNLENSFRRNGIFGGNSVWTAGDRNLCGCPEDNIVTDILSYVNAKLKAGQPFYEQS